jgi:hypothetical protein
MRVSRALGAARQGRGKGPRRGAGMGGLSRTKGRREALPVRFSLRGLDQNPEEGVGAARILRSEFCRAGAIRVMIISRT